MAAPVTVLGSTVLWPTNGDTGYSANALQLQQLFATAVLPISGLYNTTTGLVGNLGYSNSNQLTLNGVPIASGSVTSVGISGANGIGVASSPITTSGTIALSLGNITPISVATTNNITMGGTAASSRFIADWSSAFTSGRAAFQTSTVNGSTILEAIPNGTATSVGLQLENNSTVGNNAIGSLFVTATEVSLNSSIRGTGTPLDLILINQTLRGLNVTTSGNAVFGGTTPLATSATDRFLYLNSMNGIPSGVPSTPTGYTGKTPLTVDTTNNVLYFYSGGAWRSSTAGGGTVTNVTVTTANGVSGSVATSTTTPAITLTLGAITPTSVASVGAVTGSNLSGTNTGDQSITLTGDVTGSGTGSFAATLANTAVTPGSYTYTNLTVDAKGRITAASSGTPPVTTPAGSDTEIQFNNSGVFGASSNLTWSGTQLTVGGNVSVTGSRFYANLTNSSATRTLLQSNVTNGASLVSTLPNGTSTTAGFFAFNNSTTTNAESIGLSINATETTINSSRNGAGTFLPLRTIVGGVTSITNDIVGNVVIGGDAALATSATNRFLYLNSMAGTPIGVPTASPLGANGAMLGKTPITVDTSNNILYFYSGGAWRAAGAGFGTVTSVGVSSSGTITVGSSPVTTSGTITVDLANTAVTPGAYTLANITIDAQGRITAAANGTLAIAAPDYTTSFILMGA